MAGLKDSEMEDLCECDSFAQGGLVSFHVFEVVNEYLEVKPSKSKGSQLSLINKSVLKSERWKNYAIMQT